MSPLTSLKEEVKTLENLDGKGKAQDSATKTPTAVVGYIIFHLAMKIL